jgi:hypothetical protein
MKNLHYEEWYSTENRHERHYFLPSTGHVGYQTQGAYVFGYNPELVSAEKVAHILRIIQGE